MSGLFGSLIPDLEYAFFVWTSYGLFTLIMIWQFLQPRLARRRIEAELQEELAMKTGSYHDPNP